MNGLLATVILLIAVAMQQFVTVMRLSGAWSKELTNTAILVPSVVRVVSLGMMMLVGLRAIFQQDAQGAAH